MLSEPGQHRGIFFGPVEALVNIRKIDGINRLHADEDYLPARSSNQINQFFIAQEIGADLCRPGKLRTSRDDIAEQRLRTFDTDRKVVINEKDSDEAAFSLCASFQFQEFVNNTLISAEAN